MATMPFSSQDSIPPDAHSDHEVQSEHQQNYPQGEETLEGLFHLLDELDLLASERFSRTNATRSQKTKSKSVPSAPRKKAKRSTRRKRPIPPPPPSHIKRKKTQQNHQPEEQKQQDSPVTEVEESAVNPDFSVAETEESAVNPDFLFAEAEKSPFDADFPVAETEESAVTADSPVTEVEESPVDGDFPFAETEESAVNPDFLFAEAEKSPFDADFPVSENNFEEDDPETLPTAPVEVMIPADEHDLRYVSVPVEEISEESEDFEIEEETLEEEENDDIETDPPTARLRELLLDLLVADAPAVSPMELDEKIRRLEHTVYEPQALSERLAPILLYVLEQNIHYAPQEVAEVLGRIINEAIAQGTEQDKMAMSRALAAALPGAFSKQLGDAPEEVIHAIAPVMGRAIKEQVRLEQDLMVDALYPVIGNTISKYMGATISQINQRVENAFSLQGIYRKWRSLTKGVSEAELILSESIPFTVEAVFLIHKESGLVIAEAQKSGQEALESDMLAGMLTAIRSFASECTIKPGNTSELTEIDYENFRIILEVAGSCYLAAVTEGDPPTVFYHELRQTLSHLILNYEYGELIDQYQGDPETIPEAIPQQLQQFMEHPFPEEKKRHFPWGLVGLLIGLVLPIGFYFYRANSAEFLEQKIVKNWEQTPELGVYRLEAEVKRPEVTLTGKVPNEYLRQQAQQTAASVVPNLQLNNEIAAVKPAPNLGEIQEEMQRLVTVLNEMMGTDILAHYEQEQQRIWVEGQVESEEVAQQVAQSFEQIPGVDSVLFTLNARGLPVNDQIYFDTSETRIASREVGEKLVPLVDFLKKNPQIYLKIIGHTDASGEEQYNKDLAVRRAETVQDFLVEQGIAAQRLEVSGDIQPPPEVTPDTPFWLSRIVRFEWEEVTEESTN